MPDALPADIPAGPQTDVLTEQPEAPRPIETKPETEEPKVEPKPEAKKSPDEKRSDAVQKAIDKTLKSEPEKAEKAEKAEPEPKAEPKPEAKTRAPDGKFAPVAEPQPEAKAEPKPTAFKDPPGRFDEAAKKEWEAVPESVRGNIHRMHRETEQGIQKYREPAERYEQTFKRFDEIAKQRGADPAKSLEAYVRLDQLLKTDMVAGLAEIVAAQGKRGQNGQPITLRDIAGHIMGQKPEQIATKQEATIQSLRSELAQVKQQIGGFSQHIQQQQTQAKKASVASEWDAFVKQNPRASQLEAEIADTLKRYPARDNVTVRERLADAFAIAAARNPDTSAAHTGTPALAQTQAPRQPNPAGTKSVAGAATGDPKQAHRKLSRADAVTKAMKQAGL